jgi:hypothetical protein
MCIETPSMKSTFKVFPQRRASDVQDSFVPQYSQPYAIYSWREVLEVAAFPKRDSLKVARIQLRTRNEAIKACVKIPVMKEGGSIEERRR